MMQVLVVVAILCLLALTLHYPRPATVLWVLATETSPDQWLDGLVGGYETIIAGMKAFGFLLVLVLALRGGWRGDRWNPAIAFALMFLVGLMHGLLPGLSGLESLRSLLGSAGPFLFGFVLLRGDVVAAVEGACLWGPLFTVLFGALLAAIGLDHMYAIQQGAIRLGASGQAPFLAGFALVGVYAALRRLVAGGGGAAAALLGLNLLIVALTGARMPIILGLGVTLAALAMQRRVMALAAAGGLAAIMLIFAGAFSFLRVIDLAQLGEATDLSNRDLVWPYFQAAIAASPLVGWGVGAGKIVIPLTNTLAGLIGTNAAHNEYLRIGTEGGALGLTCLIGLMVAWLVRGTRGLPPAERWLMRLIFAAFAVHSATDNTLIATTASVFFLWVSTVFAKSGQLASEAA
jgi:O-antigen ligase